MKRLIIIPILLLSILCNAQFTKSGGMFLKTGSGFMTATITEEESAEAPSFLTSDGYTLGWYEVGDGSSTYLTLDGTAVSAIKDQSGNGNDLVQSTADYKPSYDSGNDEIDWGENDYITDESFSTDHPATIYMVFKLTTKTAGRIIDLGSNTYISTQADANYEFIMVVGSETINLPNSDMSLDTYYLVTLFLNNDVSNGSGLSLNNSAADMGTGGASSGTVLRLKNEWGTQAFSIKEFIFREGVIDSGDDLSAVKSYLNTKYSIY